MIVTVGKRVFGRYQFGTILRASIVEGDGCKWGFRVDFKVGKDLLRVGC